jgi:hypothetical protein
VFSSILGVFMAKIQVTLTKTSCPAIHYALYHAQLNYSKAIPLFLQKTRLNGRKRLTIHKALLFDPKTREKPLKIA